VIIVTVVFVMIEEVVLAAAAEIPMLSSIMKRNGTLA
jgi:hypothetical protein